MRLTYRMIGVVPVATNCGIGRSPNVRIMWARPD
jgi:hypothetical protein